MALLYSLLNAEPAPLPKRSKINGVTRTDSSSFTAEELNQVTITRDRFKNLLVIQPLKLLFGKAPATQCWIWLIQKSKNDGLMQSRQELITGVFGALLASDVYQTLRTAAAADLTANMLVTELIAALSDAKLGEPNEEIIGSAMQELLGELALPGDEVEALYYTLKANGLYELYPIPGFVEPEPELTPEPRSAPEEAPVVITEPIDEPAPEEEEEETITFRLWHHFWWH